jgi:uncharacterized FlaG/YvyC family protein
MKKANSKVTVATKTEATTRSKKNQSLKRIDPILEELYAVKAAINKEANYSVKEILKRAYPTVVS